MSFQDADTEVREKAAAIFRKHAKPEAPVHFDTGNEDADAAVDEQETPADEAVADDPVEETIDLDGTAEEETPTSDDGAEPETDGFSEEFVALGQSFGVDVSRFSSEADATAAMSLMAERLAALGRETPETSATPAEEAAPAKDSAEIDLSKLDPAVARVVKKIQEDNQALRTQMEEAQRTAQESNANAVRAQFMEQSEQATKYLDSLATPELGVGENLTLAQQLMRQNTYKLAGSILRGLISSQGVEKLPDLTSIVKMALSVQGIKQTAPEKKGQKTSLAGKKVGGSVKHVKLPPANSNLPPHLKGFMDDPHFREGLNRIKFSK